MTAAVSAFRLEGSSMLPVFRAGDLVLVSAAAPKRGDCAVYSYAGRTLLHRLLRSTPEGAWLADDAGRLEPHLVPWADIKGRVLSRNLFAGGFTGLIYSGFRRGLSKIFLHA